VSESATDTETTETESTETPTPEVEETASPADAPVDGVDAVVPAAPVERRPLVQVTGPSAATGRRKQAIARVRLVPGTGVWQINGRTLEDFFPNKVHQQIVNEPMVTLDIVDRYDVLVRVHGGGVSGQAGAVRLGVARALIETDADARPPLKKAGFLTRDARAKERKKYGLKKARKAPQYSKR
jgi:small subunit ribosomal protein S9